MTLTKIFPQFVTTLCQRIMYGT